MLSNNAESETTILTALQGSSYQRATEGSVTAWSPPPRPAPASSSGLRQDHREEVRQALAFAYPYEDAAAAGGEIRA